MVYITEQRLLVRDPFGIKPYLVIRIFTMLTTIVRPFPIMIRINCSRYGVVKADNTKVELIMFIQAYI